MERSIQSLFNELSLELDTTDYIKGTARTLPILVAGGVVLEHPYDAASVLYHTGAAFCSTGFDHERRSIRKELSGENVEFRNSDEWCKQLNGIAADIHWALSPQSEGVQLKFIKLLMYGECDFSSSIDTHHGPDTFGTLLFLLPTDRPDLGVTLHDVYQASGLADVGIAAQRSQCSWVAFYSGMHYSVAPVDATYQVMLSYGLVRRNRRPWVLSPGAAASELFATVIELLRIRKGTKKRGVSFPLRFSYPAGPLSPDQLNGEDAQFYQMALGQPDLNARLHYIIRDREEADDSGVDHFVYLTLNSAACSPTGLVSAVRTRLPKGKTEKPFRSFSVESVAVSSSSRSSRDSRVSVESVAGSSSPRSSRSSRGSDASSTWSECLRNHQTTMSAERRQPPEGISRDRSDSPKSFSPRPPDSSRHPNGNPRSLTFSTRSTTRCCNHSPSSGTHSPGGGTRSPVWASSPKRLTSGSGSPMRTGSPKSLSNSPRGIRGRIRNWTRSPERLAHSPKNKASPAQSTGSESPRSPRGSEAPTAATILARLRRKVADKPCVSSTKYAAAKGRGGADQEEELLFDAVVL